MLNYGIIAALVSFVLTPLIARVMNRIGAVDHADLEERKIHKKHTPLGGGLAIYFSFFLLTFVLILTNTIGGDIQSRHIVGMFLGASIIMLGGFIDDKYRLRAAQQFIAPTLAVLIVILFGVGPHQITNPLGGIISLDQLQISFGTVGTWVVLADIVVFFWLMGVMFTTKLLDGLDGLVTGVVTIGAVIIYFLSMQAQWFQPEVAALALVFAGACLGFLYWNWNPASIFLGEGGSLLTGFILGLLAIISGGKIATTLLVLGVPILDIARVLYLRTVRKQSIFVGDSEHLHFKLIHSGLNQRQAVLLFYGIALLFGMSTLFLQSRQKLIALIFLLMLMILTGLWFAKKDEEKEVDL